MNNSKCSVHAEEEQKNVENNSSKKYADNERWQRLRYTMAWEWE